MSITHLVSANTIVRINRNKYPTLLYTLCKAQRGLYAYNHIQTEWRFSVSTLLREILPISMYG